MLLRIILYATYGLALSFCAAQMVLNHRRKMRHLAPGASRWRAVEVPGNAAPELYSDAGNMYRRRERSYRIACIVLAVALFVTDQWLLRR